jgi:hypothetical protein
MMRWPKKDLDEFLMSRSTVCVVPEMIRIICLHDEKQEQMGEEEIPAQHSVV